ncbi:hypothetical protein Tco_0579017 [Tanacetum coccineum]
MYTLEMELEIIAINLDTSLDNNNTSEEIDYDSLEYKGPPKSLLKWYGYLSDEYKDKGGNESDAKPSFSDISKAKACKYSYFSVAEIIMLSSDSSDDRKGPSKANVPIFEGPSVQGLLDYYGYNDIEEYLSWNYFPSTDKENTDKDIRDKDTTDEDCIHESNVTTWEEIVNKMRVRKSKIYAEKAKGKRKVSYGSLHLQLACAACICSLHLQLAFESIAFAACIWI